MTRSRRWRMAWSSIFFSLGVFALLEISLYSYVKSDRSRFLFREDFFPGLTTRFTGVFDAELGWKANYETEHGERPRQSDHKRPYLAAFGDSYVECAEVADDETWEERLASQVKADVFNFGVGGYGPDQSLLHFQRVIDEVNPKVAAIGFIAENINRIENVYRPFYLQDSGIPLTKPRFKLTGGELELFPNPIPSLARFLTLAPRDLPRLARHDLWAPEVRYLPTFKFPYSRLLYYWPLPKRKAPENFVEKQFADRRPLWWRTETVNLLFAILDRFAAESRRRNIVPLFILLPSHTSLASTLSGDHTPEQANFAYFCKKRGYLCLDAIDCVAGLADEQHVSHASVMKLYEPRGHLGPAGNARIAKCAHDLLEQKRLLPEPIRTALSQP